MKITENTLKPESVAERDGIAALKLAINSYAPGDYGYFFTCGKLLRTVDADYIDWVRATLQNTDRDDYGRDPAGIDITAALRVLDDIVPII